MEMSETTLHIYEALTDIGIDPDKARRVERELEATRRHDPSQFERNILHRMMTREDGQRLRADMHKAFQYQLRWLITTMIASCGLAVAAIKVL